MRLGPNEVSINDVDAITPVYNFEKTYSYEAFICYGERNMFSTLNRKNHAPKRKNLGAEYSRTNVLRPESLNMVYDRCHQMVAQTVPDSPRDIFPLLNYMTQYIISSFFFGDKNGSCCLQGEDTDFLGAWHIRHPTFHWLAELPAVANMIYGSKFGDYLPTWRKAWEGEKKIIEIYDKWMERLDPQESYLYSKLVKAGLPPNEIGAEVMDHMGAGHETSGTTLTFLIDFLSKHPKI
ncbi:hypothetical protein OEA41_000276 [Lepraria neglecta]|uniref:Cytochrome P450 n=1 Tax=Lepraria neglecta TaxID=209136 RepID=A0AAD9ZGA8_9LECA|nr:hypothetical protein OEA41_000276 [Lepraria neglecta]